MARNRRRQPPRRTRVRQNSPFLDLPGEIRTLIYRAALISPKPIDLWPHEFVEKPEDDPALAPRIAELRKKRKILESWVPIFRKQVSHHCLQRLKFIFVGPLLTLDVG